MAADTRAGFGTWRGAAGVLAALGFGIALYLAADQLGEIARVYEPFFGQGSEAVLHARGLRILPVPDALLGALGYGLELVLGLAGGAERERRRPWLVLMYGLLALALALTGAALVVAQAWIVRQFCTLCLTSAALSVGVFLLALPEARATWRHVNCRHEAGIPWIEAWHGSP